MRSVRPSFLFNEEASALFTQMKRIAPSTKASPSFRRERLTGLDKPSAKVSSASVRSQDVKPSSTKML